MTEPKMTEEEAAAKAAAELPLEKQIKAVERELKMRRSVYLRRVQSGQMTPQQMAAGTWDMLAVLGTLRKLAGPPPPPAQASLL